MTNKSNHRLNYSTLILALVCCCAAMMFSSCSKKAGNALIGKWQTKDVKGVVEFKSDGTMINNLVGETVNGRYEFSDETHMKLEMAIPKGKFPGETNISDYLSVDCVIKIIGDDCEMEISGIMPGDPKAQVYKETVHMTRIK